MKWTVVLGAALVVALASWPAAQSPADYQALRKEVDMLRERLIQLQKEVDTLKTQRAAAPATASGPIVPVTNVTLNLAKAPFRGSAAAKVTMVEISDFECPFCGRYSRDTGPQILSQYADSNKIGYAFVHLPLAIHKMAPKASEAAACAGDQGKFWEMHDILFAKQGVALAPVFLSQKAELIPGLNRSSYQTCLDSSKHADYVKADMAQVQRYGLTGTPAFYIGTMDPATRMFRAAVRIVGSKPLAVFQQALDEQLARTAP